METVIKQRVLYLDVVKFVAITLVCIGHSYPLTIGYESHLRPIIYSFHMPLFMLICGYFSVSFFQRNFKYFLKQKTTQLLIPAFSGIILSLCLMFILASESISLSTVVAELYGGLWFLKTLFICYLIVYVFKRFYLPDWFACLSSIILFLILPYGGTLQVNFLLIMFWTGYFVNKSKCEGGGNCKLLLTSMSLLLFILVIYIGMAQPVQQITSEVIFTHPLDLVRQFFVGIAGSISMIGIIYYICRKTPVNSTFYKILTWLGTVGRYTLGIYVVQTLLLERLFYTICPKINHFTSYTLIDFVFTPIVGIVFSFLSYYTVLFLKKNRYMNLLLFGGSYK